MNPGGPGASAVGEVYYQALGDKYLPSAIFEMFDISESARLDDLDGRLLIQWSVGLDPRGVGLSSPLRCDPELSNVRVDWFPEDQASFDRLVERNRAFGESCLNRTGELFYHIDTMSAGILEPHSSWLFY